MRETDLSNAQDFLPVPLSEIAHVEMGQSPESKYVIEDPFVGHPFLQGNAEFGLVFPEPKYGCLRPAKLCKVNDVLISVRAPVGAVNLADRDYCIGRGLAAVRISGIKPSLAGEIIARQSPALRRVAQGTTFEAINKSDLLSLSIKLPPKDERLYIAEIFDTLDTVIQETEASITKLKAVKQGLLHDLLTRGIDANGELRPPRAEAPQLYKESPLGEIPREWDVTTLESVSSMVTSGSRDWARFYADSGALFVRIGNLTRDHVNFRYDSTVFVRPPRNADGQRTRLEPGDILISITADLGIVGVVPDGIGEAYINQHIALVRPNLAVVNSRFVGHYLASSVAQTYISKLNDAGAKAGLNLPTVRGLVTVKPKRVEQDLIAARLDEIDNRIQNAEAESAKLRELKAGLIDDLLTGRVRVTRLLDEAEPQGGSA
ncbi:restriction endonuclease subunit S [Burkholderia ubonensis]|uniref:restriction endonuclease subunit S n=1 Tax=Burkholderia ubonensis TaxID=101571 RepID=UPI0009B3F40D|nr:restriction endonuclease subunit S [Burkholderia ubonensis]